jgi:hypothetical protein
VWKGEKLKIKLKCVKNKIKLNASEEGSGK